MAVAVVMMFIVPANRKPSSATAWLLLMIILPFAGLVLFVLIGSPKLPKRRRDAQRNMNKLIGDLADQLKEQTKLKSIFNPEVSERYSPFITLNTNLTSLPSVGGNKVELIPSYETVYKKIAGDIDRASKFVHVEYFAVSRDNQTAPVFEAMERAVRRGVSVRVLIDHLGSRKYPNFKQLQETLTRAGIENHLSLPLRFFGKDYTRYDLRNHRKIVVIDGQTGYTGSQNLIQRNYFRKDKIYYDELVARIQGPAAAELAAIFATDWYSETGQLLTSKQYPNLSIDINDSGGEMCQVVPSGSGYESENNLILFTSLFYAAKHKIVITNPYFVPDDSLMTALTTAAQRGVEVALINSEASDQFFVAHAERSYYEQLLKSGIKIYRYKAPILLHSKHITIDDDIAVIGSSNMDIRSFELNLEISLICYGTRVVSELRRVEKTYLRKSNQVSLNEWQARSISEKLFENISRLTAALQ